MKFIQTAAMASLGLLICAVAGCSDQGPDVASLETGSQAEMDSDSGRATALVNCLVDHDLPATLTELGDGSLVPTWDDTKANVVSTRALNGQQVTAYLGDDDSSDGAIFPRRDTAWGLVIDGVDYSEIYTECRASSGYIETWEQPGDPAEELVAKAETAAVSNDWARCARDNGWPEVADATAPVADGYETSPTVLLPITMTEDQLTALLEVCPLVADPVTGKKPSVYFDYDPMTTTYDQDERIWALTDILYAAQQADWEQEPAQ